MSKFHPFNILIIFIAIHLAIRVYDDFQTPKPSLEYTARAALSEKLDAFHGTGDGSVDIYLAESGLFDDELIISVVCGRYGDELFVYSGATEQLYFRPKPEDVDQRSATEISLAFFWHAVCKHGDPAAVRKLMDNVNSADKLWLLEKEHVIEKAIASDSPIRPN